MLLLAVLANGRAARRSIRAVGPGQAVFQDGPAGQGPARGGQRPPSFASKGQGQGRQPAGGLPRQAGDVSPVCHQDVQHHVHVAGGQAGGVAEPLAASLPPRSGVSADCDPATVAGSQPADGAGAMAGHQPVVLCGIHHHGAGAGGHGAISSVSAVASEAACVPGAHST